MARLLAPLEQISQQHPEPVIQELASDLRATIATRGAYQSDSVTNVAQYYSHSSYAQTKNQETCPNKENLVKSGGASERSQNTACPGTVGTSAEVKEQARSFQHTDGKSFRLKPAVSTHVSAPTAPTVKKVFSEWLLEACDPDVPTRAMALRALTQCLKEGTEEAIQGRDKLLMVSLSFDRIKRVCLHAVSVNSLAKRSISLLKHIVFEKAER